MADASKGPNRTETVVVRTYFKQERKIRNDAHLKWIRTLPSVIDGAGPCVAHHLLCVDHGFREKAGDNYTLPITGEQHYKLHEKVGSNGVWEEKYWWDTFRINPKILARSLYSYFTDQTLSPSERMEQADYLIHTHKCRRCYIEPNDPR